MADAPAFLTVRELKSPDLNPGAPFSAVLVVKKLQVKTASNGNPFLSLELGDRGGSFSCTIFGDSPLFDPIKSAGEGSVVRIEGRNDSFQGRFSPKLTKAFALSEEQIAAEPGLVDALVELPPESGEAMWVEFQTFLSLIHISEPTRH